jgi:hypothetical protein
LVRSSPSKIFRPKANTSVSLALSSVQRAHTLAPGPPNFALFAGVRQKRAKRICQRQEADFCSLFDASVPQTPAQWIRQHQGANFYSLFDASVPQTPAQWIRQRREANFCSLFNASVPQALAKRMRQRAREPSSASSPNADIPKAPAQWMTSGRPNCPTAPAAWGQIRPLTLPLPMILTSAPSTRVSEPVPTMVLGIRSLNWLRPVSKGGAEMGTQR